MSAARVLVVLSFVCALAARAGAQTPDVSGFRTFASWPDDAQVLSSGSGVVSLALSTWRWSFGSGVAVPAIYASAGIAPGVQISATFERDFSRYTDNTNSSATGDTYVIGKIALLDPERYKIGVAVSPLVQILGNESLTYYRYYKSSDTRRAQFGLPVHFQLAVGPARVSASAGFFSIGSTFVTGGIEVPVTPRLVVNGSVSQAFSTETVLSDSAANVSRHRTDATGGVSVILSPAVFLFGSIGRTISHTDQNSMTLSANAGLAFYWGD